MNNAPVLVTGAHGFLGRNVVEALNDFKVFAPPRSELDCRDVGELSDYVARHAIRFVVHCAGPGTQPKRDEPGCFDNIVGMFFNLVRLRERFDKVICVGTGHEFLAQGRLSDLPCVKSYRLLPENLYGFAKLICNNFIHDHGLQNFINVRIFYAFGKHEDPDARLMPRAISHLLDNTDVFIDHDALLSFIYATDFARFIATLLTAERYRASYHACYRQPMRLSALLAQAKDLCGSRSKIVMQDRRCEVYTSAAYLPGFQHSEKNVVELLEHYTQPAVAA
ncbi:MAG: NAD-dependent epimerase/dehydratase family protein [Candidatus Omnitrophica bacterium]|nr:NAD-dependent epimerase/dehydratase family protein [Candidatus Omnitrophota bacterium]MBI3021765.1 NAD-dependent epimerase/dehydratase family protein [Candidatus Omnitrophota bacterium]